MTDQPDASTGLAESYTSRVESDLADVSRQITELEARLATLRADQKLLIEFREHLRVRTGTGDSDEPSSGPVQVTEDGSRSTAAATDGESAPSPAARHDDEDTTDGPQRERPSSPTWGELIFAQLQGATAPVSVSEVGTALRTAHPDRTVNDVVIRSTLESLVAKSKVERARQGRSVYYTLAPAARTAARKTRGKSVKSVKPPTH